LLTELSLILGFFLTSIRWLVSVPIAANNAGVEADVFR
jgi:hypothetical protein